MTAPLLQLPAPPVLLAPKPRRSLRARPGRGPQYKRPQDGLLRPAHSAPAGPAPRGSSGGWVPSAAVTAVSSSSAPTSPPAQYRPLPRAEAWSWGPALSGGVPAPPPAHEGTSLPACASGVRPTRDGYSEELAVPRRVVLLQVPPRCWWRAAGEWAGDEDSARPGSRRGPCWCALLSSAERAPAPRPSRRTPGRGGLPRPRPGPLLSDGSAVIPPAGSQSPRPPAVFLGGSACPRVPAAPRRRGRRRADEVRPEGRRARELDGPRAAPAPGGDSQTPRRRSGANPRLQKRLFGPAVFTKLGVHLVNVHTWPRCKRPPGRRRCPGARGRCPCGGARALQRASLAPLRALPSGRPAPRPRPCRCARG